MKTKLVLNTTILTLSNIATRIISLIFFVLLANVFEIKEYGLFRYLLSLSLTYAILFSGLTVAMTKYLSASKNKVEAYSYLTNGILLVCIAFLITLTFAWMFNENFEYLILFLFAALIDFVYLGIITGRLDYKKLNLFRLTENIIQLTLVFSIFCIFKVISIFAAVISFSISGLLSLVFYEYKNRSKLYFSIGLVSMTRIKELLKFALPVMLGAVGWELMFNLNTIFIKHLLDVKEVAFYSVGRTIVQVFTFLPLAITTIMLPKASATEDRAKVAKYAKYAVIINLILSFIGLLILLMLGKWIIYLLFGTDYIQGYSVILFLGLGQIFIASYLIYSSVWQGFGKPLVPSLILIAACIINIAGNIFLIPLYGIVGASIATAVSSFIAFILSLVIFHNHDH